MTNAQLDNERGSSIIKEVEFIVIQRKVRIIGIAISLGIVMAYIFALFVSGENINPKMAILNLLSLIFCFVICLSSFYVRRFFLKAINSNNFSNKYFTAYIITFAMCDAGGLVCIIINLVLNQNMVYATTGLIISIFCLLINFPRKEDFRLLNIR
ncbi:hypothetical protein ACFLSV_02820 [Bacteroidota bacterium]